MKNNVTFLALIAALGGFLFGYDTAIISGTIGFVKTQFDLGTLMEGWYVSSALVGTILGVSFAGVLSDAYGRKNILIVSALFFALSAIGCALSGSFTALVAYRLIGGIGVGVASMLSPLYISEIAPAKSRGRLVALYQLAITLGILVAYFANSFLLSLSVSGKGADMSAVLNKIVVTEVWRAMLGSETIPALLFLFLLLLIPKSPKWLTMKGKSEEARSILLRFMGREEANREIGNVQEVLRKKSGGIATVLSGPFKLAMLLGVSLAVLSQVSGINAIIYYGPRILEEGGLQLGEALGGQVVIGVVNVLFTFLALWKIDDLGRKPLLVYGVLGIMISLITIGGLFYFEVDNALLLMIFVLTFIACFAFSFGPVLWVLLAEIYPLKMRGAAMSVATMAVWVGTTFVGQMTPWFLENLKPYGTFWLFAACMVPAFYLVVKVLPETKGKTLEQIENYWLTK
ncbi:sugar porter family MFS transporter [Pseudozobellia thermophila]|uniref:MFS transporter, sugar porter (SP) family n=1 Tax=Pseudozobellia thermophila TaxID=192903 RepID=A0A1M6GDN2_9FLAO|nr:sugar porter family MFS transporter [Pseudozobellia thermophila]SHJ08044.1 MFS transporter, sugar porter (SP) family [Pseudozobellia thermophila]